MEKLKDVQEVTSVAIDGIRGVRSENNDNWMAILDIAARHAPEETGKVLRRIGQCDKEIVDRMKELAEVLSK